MRRTILKLAGCGVLMAILAGTALGHHGWTGYDETKTITLTGVIREASYENPHALIKLQVDGGKGKTWLAYLAPPSRMDSRGFKKDALKVGAAATLVGYPSRTVSDEMRAERITMDGKTIELR
jgi:hypothetical protein